MKNIWLIWIALALMFWTGTASAQNAIEVPSQNIVSSNHNTSHNNVSQASSVQWNANTGSYVRGKPWDVGVGFYGGIGPAFDLRDPAAGFSGRIGVNCHGRYVGLGLEGTVNMLWATVDAKRSDHLDQSYRVTNGGLMLVGNAYIPATDHLVFKLGGGGGLGKRHEIYFSNLRWSCSDTSWLARAQLGAFYLFNTSFTLGIDVEINFGNYIKHDYKYWSDKELDVSMGIVMNFSYQLLL